MWQSVADLLTANITLWCESMSQPGSAQGPSSYLFIAPYRHQRSLIGTGDSLTDTPRPPPPTHHHHRCQGNNASLVVTGPHPTTHTAALILTWAATSWRLMWSRGWQDRSEHFRTKLVGVWTVKNKIPRARASARAEAHQRFSFSSACLLERNARALVHAHSCGDREEGRKADLPADSGSSSV